MALNRSQGSIRRRTRSVLRAGRRRAERAWAGAETRRRRAVGGGATDEGWRPWLTPLLVDVFGRDGSTLTMRLLATSPAIAVEPPHGADLDRFERPYFAWLWGWSRLPDARRRKQDDERAAASVRKALTQPAGRPVGPPHWWPRPLFEPGMREIGFSERMFELAWSEFSARAAWRTAFRHGEPGSAVRLYAEKHYDSWKLDRAALPEHRLLVLLRDPRDSYVSRDAFSAKRGTAGFGRDRADDDEEYLALFLKRQRARLRWIAELEPDDGLDVLRYEDLVLRMDEVAARLGRWLDTEFDVGEVEGDRDLRGRHVTAGSPEASVGRWRSDLDPSVAERITAELGDELRANGFED